MEWTAEGALQRPRNRRLAMLAITLLPFAGLVAAVVLLWQRAVGWTDLALFGTFYVMCGMGITVGFHRMIAHKSFEAVPPLKVAILVAGSLALQGSVLSWVIDHRAHHAYSDKEGDPHSPHAGYGPGLIGTIRGLLHAHVGWLARHSREDRERYAKDVLQDPVAMRMSRLFPLFGVLTFVLPCALGGLLTWSWKGAATGLIWGGLVRLFFNYHVTWSVNSICHFFGARPFTTSDFSTNNWLLALPSFGESWHNNHHEFPASAFHGFSWRQADPSAWFIAACERVGLASEVRKPSTEQIERRIRVTA